MKMMNKLMMPNIIFQPNFATDASHFAYWVAQYYAIIACVNGGVFGNQCLGAIFGKTCPCHGIANDLERSWLFCHFGLCL